MMNSKSITPENDADGLAWLAERYVLGELDATLRDAMEQRLVADQSAREAVAAALMLLAATHACETTASSPSSRPLSRSAALWRSRNLWLAGTAAAILIGAFVATQANWFEVDSDSALASAWYDSHDLEGQVDANEEISAYIESGTPSLDDVDTPDWLITAMSLHQEGVPIDGGSAGKPSAGEGA